MTNDIVSVHNARVKQWSALSEKKHRDREGKYIIEGVHLVKEALINGVRIETLIFLADKGIPGEIAAHLRNNTETIAVSGAVLAKCTDTVTPQGICAIVCQSGISAEHILQNHRSLVMVIDGIQDPGNLGTIIRSADAVGATAVLLGEGTVDLYNPKTVRAAMGSLFHLPIAVCDLNTILPQARRQAVQVVSTRPDDAVSCYEADFTRDSWIIVGNEGYGVSETAARYADLSVNIPMSGRAESLNVAMAATVLLFEAMRQRTVN